MLYSLPIKLGGLNIKIPTSFGLLAYEDSRAATHLLVDAIKGLSNFSLIDHEALVMQTKFDSRNYQ